MSSKEEISILQKQIRMSKSEQISVNQDIRSTQEALNKLKNDYKDLNNRMNEEISKKSKEAKDIKIKEECSVFEEDLEMLNKRKLKIQKKYDESVDKISYDNIKKSYSEHLNLIGSIDSMMKQSEEQMDILLSKRFRKELDKQLENKEVVLNLDELEEYTERFNKRYRKANGMSRVSSINFLKLIDKFFMIINPCKDDSAENVKSGLLIYAIICIVITLVTIIYLGDLFVILITALAGYNIFKSAYLYKLYLEYKVINDNKNRMSNSIEKEINDEVEYAYKKNKERLDRKISEIDKDIRDIENSKQEIVNQVNNTFKFDDREIRKKYDDIGKDLKKSIADAEKNKLKYETKLQQILDTIKNNNAKLSKLFYELPNILLNIEEPLTQDFYLLESEFFMDLNEEAKTPIYWYLPESMCFMCNTNKTLFELFVELFLIQIYGKLCPFYIDVTYIDLINGSTLPRKFLNYSSEVTNTSFKLIDSEEELKKFEEIVRLEFKRRDSMMSKKESNIEEFNEMMYKNKAVPIDYKFYIFQNYDLNFIFNRGFIKYINRAYELGMIFIFNINLAEFIKVNEDELEELLNRVADMGGLFMLSKNDLRPTELENSDKIMEFLEMMKKARKDKKDKRLNNIN